MELLAVHCRDRQGCLRLRVLCAEDSEYSQEFCVAAKTGRNIYQNRQQVF